MINYANLYYHKEVRIKGDIVNKPYPIDLDIAIKGFDLMPDCQIGHFGYNFYFRTPYGMKRKRYKSEKTLENAVNKILKNKGITVIEWVNKK